jgi:hypothetical protein
MIKMKRGLRMKRLAYTFLATCVTILLIILTVQLLPDNAFRYIIIGAVCAGALLAIQTINKKFAIK